MKVRNKVRADREWIVRFLNEHWGGETCISRGRKHLPADAEGLVADDNGQVAGLLTYRVENGEVEILTLNSLVRGKGVGTLLINRLVGLVRVIGCTRMWAVTNNDNTDAMRFYQKRGFDLKALHRGAVAEARKLKPSIPEVGAYGIPVRHELEFEMSLR